MAVAAHPTPSSAFGFKAQWHPLRHIMRGVWLQALRRNEVYIVAILLGLYLAGVLVLRIVGIGSEQVARFVSGLGLQMGSMLSTALVIVMGARQIPVEIEQRTLYPVLAKPVRRGEILLGKGLPTWMLGMAAMLMFLAVTLAAAPHQPYQHFGVLLEALACKAASLAMLTGLVFWLSLWVPPSLAMLAAGLLAYLGSMPIHWIANQPAIAGLAGLLPDFELLEQFLRFVDGGPLLGPGAMAGLLGMGALWTAFFCGASLFRFRRQAL